MTRSAAAPCSSSEKVTATVLRSGERLSCRMTSRPVPLRTADVSFSNCLTCAIHDLSVQRCHYLDYHNIYTYHNNQERASRQRRGTSNYHLNSRATGQASPSRQPGV